MALVWSLGKNEAARAMPNRTASTLIGRGQKERVISGSFARERGSAILGNTAWFTHIHPGPVLRQILSKKAVEACNASHVIETSHIHKNIAGLFPIYCGMQS